MFFATLFLVTAWSAFRELVMRFDWYVYLVLAIVFAVPSLGSSSEHFIKINLLGIK